MGFAWMPSLPCCISITAGAKDNGRPGYRDYSPGYYAAFIYDPDGHNIEAVWYDPSKEK